MIQQATFERLQRHAQPLVDTTDMVVNRALDALEIGEEKTVSEHHLRDIQHVIKPQELPDLTHTKILAASLLGKPVLEPRWNKLLELILILAMKKLGSLEDLRQLCQANIVQGCKQTEGYRYLTDVNISVQNMSANSACKVLVSVAQYLGFGINIILIWRPHKSALYPGEKARLFLPENP